MVTWNHDVCALPFMGCQLCHQPCCIVEHNIRWYDGNCYLLFACGFCLPLAHKILIFLTCHFSITLLGCKPGLEPVQAQAKPSPQFRVRLGIFQAQAPTIPAWRITICKVFVPTLGLWSNPCTWWVFAWTCTCTALCEFVLSNLATDTEKELLDRANVAVGIKYKWRAMPLAKGFHK